MIDGIIGVAGGAMFGFGIGYYVGKKIENKFRRIENRIHAAVSFIHEHNMKFMDSMFTYVVKKAELSEEDSGFISDCFDCQKEKFEDIFNRVKNGKKKG
jgi:hypothetical protein